MQRALGGQAVDSVAAVTQNARGIERAHEPLAETKA
jgi:hypothetical protein